MCLFWGKLSRYRLKIYIKCRHSNHRAKNIFCGNNVLLTFVVVVPCFFNFFLVLQCSEAHISPSKNSFCIVRKTKIFWENVILCWFCMCPLPVTCPPRARWYIGLFVLLPSLFLMLFCEYSDKPRFGYCGEFNSTFDLKITRVSSPCSCSHHWGDLVSRVTTFLTP